jgi:hypothetical protein
MAFAVKLGLENFFFYFRGVQIIFYPPSGVPKSCGGGFLNMPGLEIRCRNLTFLSLYDRELW